jgi:hypothetical protein
LVVTAVAWGATAGLADTATQAVMCPAVLLIVWAESGRAL